MNLIFTMTLSGCILYVLILGSERLFKGMFSRSYRYFLLKIALIFHLLPLAGLKFLMPSPGMDASWISGASRAILITSDRVYMTIPLKLQMAVLLLWLCIAVVKLILCLRSRKKMKSMILRASHESTDTDILNMVAYHRKNLGIRQKVVIYITAAHIPPITFGIIHPVIVLPETLHPRFVDSAIYHELCHIKRKDEMFVLLRILVVSLYWFNPLTFKLSSSVEENCDLACDEFVTRDLDWRSRKDYGRDVIELAASEYTAVQYPFLTFCSNKKIFQERIDTIMTPAKKFTPLALLLSFIILLGSALPAFAYTPPIIVSGDENLLPVDINMDVQIFVPDGEVGKYSISHPTILYDSQFTDMDGNIYPVEENSPYAACEHTYVTGEYSVHSRHADGSCTVKMYSAERCTKCSHVRKTKLISTIEYPECPH